MSTIKVLDCTLRDGGYVNEWNFGEQNIKKIIQNLVHSKVEYIECGFLKPVSFYSDKSLYTSISNLENVLPENSFDTKYTLMINFGDCSIEEIPQCSDKNICIRVAFKKKDRVSAIDFCKKLVEKGYGIFVNPMHTNTYSSYELLELIKNVNDIKPIGFTIVDTTGAMKEKDILTSFYLIEEALDKDIALCFHSHNNLQLSFSNAQCLMKICTNRELIIDSTVFGMGRGAGNLCTELLTQYINDNYDGKYNIVPILKIIDEQINPIFAKTPWGYSVPYYLAAINFCHPNYAKFLVDKQTIPVEKINILLQSIPNEKKGNYDEGIIKQIYLDKFSNLINDKNSLEDLKNLLKDKNILVLAPGKTLATEKDKILNFINTNNPFIISLNFEPKEIKSDVVFITNAKRFLNLNHITSKLFVTSNIDNLPKNTKVLNYSSYLNNSQLFDNAFLILLEVLQIIGIKSINVAGLDGFSKNFIDNYYEDSLINYKYNNEVFNDIMSTEIKRKNEYIDIKTITNTKYDIESYVCR